MILSSVDLPEPFGPEHADLGVRVEGEVDVLQHLLAAGEGLGQALHVIDELARHRCPLSVSSVSREVGGYLGDAGRFHKPARARGGALRPSPSPLSSSQREIGHIALKWPMQKSTKPGVSGDLGVLRLEAREEPLVRADIRRARGSRRSRAARSSASRRRFRRGRPRAPPRRPWRAPCRRAASTTALRKASSCGFSNLCMPAPRISRSGSQAEEEAGRGPAAPVAVPEPEVDVVLVGPLVLGEAHVAIDAEERAVDLRLEGDARREIFCRRGPIAATNASAGAT